MGSAIVWLFNAVIGLAIFLIFASAIISWLVAFNVINTRNPTIYQIVRMLDAMTTPILAPIRRFVPSLGGVDISPIIAWLVLGFIQILFNRTLAPLLVGALG